MYKIIDETFGVDSNTTKAIKEIIKKIDDISATWISYCRAGFVGVQAICETIITFVFRIDSMGKYEYINRDISWLSFNFRVLQEAMDKTLPLFERIKFLASTI